MKNIDMTDFYIFILSIVLAVVPICFGINLLIDGASTRKQDFEEHCVEYYLENNYVLSECEQYVDKLKDIPNLTSE